MIKILKHGKPKRTTCKGCRSKLEYEGIDKEKEPIEENIFGHRMEYITCPVCGRKIYTIK